MSDYIKLYRSMLDWEWYKNINTKVLFIHMLLKANWKDGKFEGKVIPRGSFVSSLAKLADETDLTIREVRTAISHLETSGELTIKRHSKYSVFTIKNYVQYQASDNQSTGRRHSVDIQTTTIEEKKEVKKGRNNICDDDGARARETAASLVDKYWGRKATDADMKRISTLIRDFKNRTVNEDKLQLLEYAFECSLNANAMNWNYIQGVFDRLRARGITTLDQAYEFDVKRDFGG